MREKVVKTTSCFGYKKYQIQHNNYQYITKGGTKGRVPSSYVPYVLRLVKLYGDTTGRAKAYLLILRVSFLLDLNEI